MDPHGLLLPPEGIHYPVDDDDDDVPPAAAAVLAPSLLNNGLHQELLELLEPPLEHPEHPELLEPPKHPELLKLPELQEPSTDDFEHICRVCRFPSADDDPLFHPCKCSGSMKFVHQLCLEEWLAHSGKQHCEICNHPFVFSSIYAESAPVSIAWNVALGIMLQRAYSSILQNIRIGFAACLWLLWVPYVTLYTWRLFLDPASIAERMLHYGAPAELQNSIIIDYVFGNAFFSNSTLASVLMLSDWGSPWQTSLKAIVLDIFEGQKITSIAILIGIAAVFIKEYIILNTPRDENGQLIGLDAQNFEEDLHDEVAQMEQQLPLQEEHQVEHQLEMPNAPIAPEMAEEHIQHEPDLYVEVDALPIPIHTDLDVSASAMPNGQERRPGGPHFDKHSNSSPISHNDSVGSSDYENTDVLEHTLLEPTLLSFDDILVNSSGSSNSIKDLDPYIVLREGVPNTESDKPRSNSSMSPYNEVDLVAIDPSLQLPTTAFETQPKTTLAPVLLIHDPLPSMARNQSFESNDHANSIHLESNISAHSESNMTTPQPTSRYDLRPRHKDIISVTGSSSTSLGHQSFIDVARIHDRSTLQPLDSVGRLSEHSKLSLRRKSSQLSMSSNNSDAEDSIFTSGVAVMTHPRPISHSQAAFVYPTQPSAIDALKIKYAGEMAILDEEVERNRQKGEMAAVDDLSSYSLRRKVHTISPSSSARRSPFESFESAHSSSFSSGSASRPVMLAPEISNDTEAFRLPLTRKVAKSNSDWNDNLSSLRTQLLDGSNVSHPRAFPFFDRSDRSGTEIGHAEPTASSGEYIDGSFESGEHSFDSELHSLNHSIQQDLLDSESASFPDQSASTHGMLHLNPTHRTDLHLSEVDAKNRPRTNTALPHSLAASSPKLPLAPFNDMPLPHHRRAIPDPNADAFPAELPRPDREDIHPLAVAPNPIEALVHDPVPPPAHIVGRIPAPVAVEAPVADPILPFIPPLAPPRQPGFQLFFGNNPDDNPQNGGLQEEGALNVNLAIDNGNIVAEVNGDVNAFLEIIGARGSLLNLVYNVVAVHALIFICTAVGIWIPFLTGKVVFLIFRDVYGPMVERLISLVSSILQLITDPILDPIVDGIFVVGSWMSLNWRSLMNSTLAVFQSNDSSGLLSGDVVNATLNATLGSATAAISAGVAAAFGLNSDLPGLVGLVSNTSILDSSAPKINASSVPVNTTLGTTQNLPVDDMLHDTALMTLLGYLTYITLFMSYANHTGLLRHPYAQTAIQLLQATVRHSLLSKKFMFFIIAEIIAFPIFCGILIDICTLPLFASVGLSASRQAFFYSHPWTCMFLHWLVGTTFMFQVAIYITFVREVVRPGVMWFMRDPNDPRFNPMQEILERPFLTQARKLAVGALLYGALIVGVIGGTVGLFIVLQYMFGIQSGIMKILPLRWEFHDHYSEFPLELLLFHFFVPLTVKFMNLKNSIRYLFEKWLRLAASILRISSFLFGGEFPEEDIETENAAGDSEEQVNPIIRYVTLDRYGNVEKPHRARRFPPSGAVEQQILLDDGDMAEVDQAEDQDEWMDEDSDEQSGVDTAASPFTKRNRSNRFAFPEPADHAINEETNGESTAAAHASTSAQHEWEDMSDSDVIDNSTESQKGKSLSGVATDTSTPPTKVLNYMRVPNHDHIEVIPGEKMMLFMAKDDPLFGREAETPEEVAHNWTKVYVPSHFFIKIYILLYLQLCTIVVSLAAVWAIPLVIGRKGFAIFNSYAIMHVPIPKEFNYTLPNFTTRPDLPIHDFYSFLVGVLILGITITPLVYAFREIWRVANSAPLDEATHQEVPIETPLPLDIDGQVHLEGEGAEMHPTGASSTPKKLTLAAKMSQLLQTYTPEYRLMHMRLLHLAVCAGCVMPLLIGLAMDMYILIPFKGNQKSASIIFFVHDWATGVIVSRILYFIITAGPDNRIKRLIAETVALGLEQDFSPILHEVVYPVISVLFVLLPLPFVVSCVGQLLGHNPYMIRDVLLRYGVGLAVGAVMSYELILVLHGWFARWTTQIRDEQYRVGRRLHNADEIVLDEAPTPRVPPVVDAAGDNEDEDGNQGRIQLVQ
ncbi:hypothetical protein BASA81_018320 [Batrachochytrium salamandrivorans]|nr:hypothetical protein BASA81_018320 [Batrachochytrium salamandrivorans]